MSSLIETFGSKHFFYKIIKEDELLGISASYEGGNFRNKGLAELMFNALPDFALDHKEFSNIDSKNVMEKLRKAEKNIQTKKMKCPEPEWIGPFLENCKDVWSKDLQSIWSKILAGKMNNQITSIRTMSVLKNITSSEADSFNSF